MGMIRGYIVLGSALLLSMSVYAAPVSNIAKTRHNLSVTGPGDTRATSQNQICVFCHTPHGANISVPAPLWNRQLTTASTYTKYTSSSMDASLQDLTSAGSRICLSCHDGTQAIGQVNVLNAQTNVSISMQGTGPNGTIGRGQHGGDSGYTRFIGTDLRNDHPIAFTYDKALAQKDGDLADPDVLKAQGVLGDRSGTGSNRIDHPLRTYNNGSVECMTCHDPHLYDEQQGNIKFLRLNRYQTANPVSGEFKPGSDIICLACHTKDGWVDSAHASQMVADETYTTSAASLRDFKSGIKVWEASCLNCHDTHTVQGSRRLLREGTDSLSRPKVGGNPALEETCYQCHSNDGATLTSQGYGTQVPDIKSDFNLRIRMPIKSSDQPARMEVHDIGTTNPDVPQHRGKDLIESAALLGKGNLNNRHAECTDCHNPHRVIRNRLFNANPTTPDAGGTHRHEAGVMHTNLASGVLRGAWGVEPVYPGSSFGTNPSNFIVKKGNPSVGASTDVSAPHVTREYQVCLKCHSNYAFDTPPMLGSNGGSTPPGTNGMTRYTNQAMEFQAPDHHMGEPVTTTDSGSAVNASCRTEDGYRSCNLSTNNHRSWHPVMKPTGRTKAARKVSASTRMMADPFDTGVGQLTMYCSDCHGSNTNSYTTTPVGGENGNAWGPHGSNNNFLLKGTWAGGTPYDTDWNGFSREICIRCHNPNNYPSGNDDDDDRTPGWPYGGRGDDDERGASGFSKDNGEKNLHRIGHHDAACTFCHVAVPHGWKNKALLINLNDVGPEAINASTGLPYAVGTRVPQGRFTAEPYYYRASNYIYRFAPSGNWDEYNCGGEDTMEFACEGKN